MLQNVIVHVFVGNKLCIHRGGTALKTPNLRSCGSESPRGFRSRAQVGGGARWRIAVVSSGRRTCCHNTKGCSQNAKIGSYLIPMWFLFDPSCFKMFEHFLSTKVADIYSHSHPNYYLITGRCSFCCWLSPGGAATRATRPTHCNFIITSMMCTQSNIALSACLASNA